MLGIRKERIDPGAPWQDYTETLFSISAEGISRRQETRFRSLQLDLWQVSDTSWLLALRRPEPVARKKQGNIVPLARQLPLPEFGATG